MTDTVDVLERLARLKAAGVLTEAEFEAQKAAVIRASTGAASGAPTYGERYSKAREETRGIRRFIRWFFGIQLVAIVMMGIYFFTRGTTLEGLRTGIGVGASTAPVAAPDSGGRTAAADIIITTSLMANKPSWEDVFQGPIRTSFCIDQDVRVANALDVPLNLNEPPRVCRRLSGLSYAAMRASSSMA